MVTIEHLLYALFLPSGNDAACCLADYFGLIMKLGYKAFQAKLSNKINNNNNSNNNNTNNSNNINNNENNN